MSSKSISQIAIKAMSIRLFVVVALSSVLSYYFNYKTLSSKSISELQKYAKERVERESIRFEQAAKNLEALDKTFSEVLELPMPDVDQRFNQLFVKRKDGSIRHRHADEPRKIQVFIPARYSPDLQAKKNLVIANELLNSFGRAWSSTFINVWLVGKEDYGATFWPSRSQALGRLPVHHSFIHEEYATIGLPKNNPFGKTTWTGPYYDQIPSEWLVSINHPVYFKGEYLFSLGMDIALDDLEKRTISNALEGTYNFIFQSDGRLIIHPHKVNDIIKGQGKYFLQKSSNPVLREAYKNVMSHPGEVIYSKDHKMYFVSGKIKGPDWFFVIAYPEANLRSLAMDTAQFVAVIGIISLLIELLMLFQVLHKFVTAPINKLIEAANRIATGTKYARVEIETEDEIGTLGRAFNTMGEKVMERDMKLIAQAEELEYIVEERTQELDLQRAKTFQSAKMATLGEMSGGIAHEINNPLSIIGLSAESIRKMALKGQWDENKLLGNVDKIERTVERISKIVKGMRSFSRNAENDPKVPVALKQIIENTLTLCEETLKKREVTLHCSEIPAISIECREVEIIQALLNLLQNAIDAVENVSTKEIHLNIVTENHLVRIQVEDSGPGISNEVAAKIMNPFFTTKEIGKGTGLGLFISLGLIESNGGRLYLDRESPKTRFVIELPMIL